MSDLSLLFYIIQYKKDTIVIEILQQTIDFFIIYQNYLRKMFKDLEKAPILSCGHPSPDGGRNINSDFTITCPLGKTVKRKNK